MNVNMNVMTNTTSKKQSIPNGSNKSEDFKSVLDNHGLNSVNSSKENAQKKCSKDEKQDKTKVENQGANVENKSVESKDVESKDIEKSEVEYIIPKDSNDSCGNVELKTNIINLIEVAIDKLEQTLESSPSELQVTDKSVEQMAQLQQLLQLLSSMFQKVPEATATINVESKPNSINLESTMGIEQITGIEQIKAVGQLKSAEQITGIEKLKGAEQLTAVKELTPDAKGMLKGNLSEIVALLEKSKESNLIPSEIVQVLQKLTTVVDELKGNLSLLKGPSMQALSINSEDKSITDSLLKKVIELSNKTISETLPKTQMQSSNSSESGSKFSGNSSSEEKFLNNLLGEDKDDMKISKAVNFMNQFETVKTVDTAKVQAVNLVIDKSNFGADVIKNIKFMEINNIKDLTVRMNPKELGEITIKLTMESGIMKASISALNKDTYNLLNQNIQDISDKLKNMDIKIQSLDINIYEDSTFFNKGSNEKNNNGNKNNNKSTNMGLDVEEDISISNNYAIEENQVNKFV
ncbi:MAG: flagellar hook-length control protein FliK [Clostridium sp.]|uniref:flagellar hook-length control protein FliK n=1 Tax=Clostridium sp. TaxID=1506 RepID=UPI003D6CEB2F